MKYKIENKEINIPDEVIDNYVDTLEVSIDEAIQIYLEDEGYKENEEVEALTKKAKENRITATIHEAKAENKTRAKRTVEKKANPDKEMLITTFAEALANIGIAASVVNNTKLIEFNYNGKQFKLDLIERRAKKKA